MLKDIISKYKTIISTLNNTEIFILYFCFYIFIFNIFGFFIYYLSNQTLNYPKYNTTINIASNQNINSLLPFEEKNTTEKVISSLIYSGMLTKVFDTQTQDYIYKNNLAESLEFSQDYKTIQIKLKDLIYFSDGTPITSDDVLWTYKIAKTVSSKYNIILEGVNIEKIDNKNIKITLKNHYPEIKDLLSLGIISQKWTESQNINSENINNIRISNIYSGIYKIKNLSEIQNYNIKTEDQSQVADKKVFELQENDYNKKPFIKYINFNLYENTESFEKDLKNKAIDIVLNYNHNLEDSEIIKFYKKINYVLPINNSLFLNSNTIKEFAKLETRKKIYNVINRLEILNQIQTLQATTTYGIIPASKNTDLVQKDLTEFISTQKTDNKIREDLSSDLSNDLSDNLSDDTQNNLSDKKSIKFYVVNTENNIRLAEYIKSKIQQISELKDYNIEILAKTPTEIAGDIIKNRNFDILIYGMEIDNYSGLYLFLHSSQLSYPGLNITTNPSSKMDSILQKIKTAKNIDEQKDIIKDLENNFYEEYPFIPIYSNNKTILVKKDFNILSDNISIINDETYLFDNISNISNQKEKIWPIFYNDKIENFLNKILH
jgi:peptide/nickel transport system substrate-binding protein